LTVLGVEPASRLGDLATLTRQAEPENRQVHEVGARVGRLVGQVRHESRLPVPPPFADLTHGDRHQPRTEAPRVPEIGEVVDDPQHGLLDDVVDIGMALESPPDDVVDERQPARDQGVQRLLVAGHRRSHGRRTWLLRAHRRLPPTVRQVLPCLARRRR
jgi:hypothetical protein